MKAVFSNRRRRYLLDHDGSLLAIIEGSEPSTTVEVGVSGYALIPDKPQQLRGEWLRHLSFCFRYLPLFVGEVFKLRRQAGWQCEVHL